MWSNNLQDSIVFITPKQLKYTNLIFVEHKKLIEENKLLANQVKNYQLKTDNLVKSDSLKTSQINSYQHINEVYSNKIEDLNKTIKKKDKYAKYWKIGGITVSLGLVLFLILK